MTAKYVLAHLNGKTYEYWFDDGYWKEAPNPKFFEDIHEARETIDFEITALIDYQNEAASEGLGQSYHIAAKDYFTTLVTSEDNKDAHLFIIVPIYE